MFKHHIKSTIGAREVTHVTRHRMTSSTDLRSTRVLLIIIIIIIDCIIIIDYYVRSYSCVKLKIE